MKLTGLLNRTDMIFNRYNGVVTDHGDHVSIETPSNPGYFWGNLLIFEKPPTEGDFVRWRRLFRHRFGSNPKIRHEVYSWENQQAGTPIVGEFLDAGFRLDQNVTMAASQLLKPAKWNPDLTFRPLDSDEDWNEALENQVLVHREEFEERSYREHRTKQNESYRRMIADGLGLWFGAYNGGRLVGDLGLFRDTELGRFQLVSTHPEFRRQGVCSGLLHFAGTYGLTKMGMKTLVIAADDTYFAKDIYRSVGFEVRERTLGLERRPEA